ncbi:recombinase family protein [Pelotomaculum propionicicum]|uniref:Recombinase domain-containing protein n=1 Tax=Pelotomaculum propionicicum TaxID=258475 RepID=A0A4Y7RMP4_9FIRM|nr:recombinase family protein [Pelotomaculum propionicicum]NLI13804.1 recombinase [Peptococcaceae bacterium]TEB10245.1 hypothetical protein Pmgp_02545 [Pelotomaculum propionicicum]
MAVRKMRYIPFGYRLVDGEITVHEREAGAVKIIFTEYLHNGRSYKDIAAMLTDQGVAYRENVLNWNKSMIKRILENPKYLGDPEYPRLIPESQFKQVAAVKNAKYTRKDVRIIPSIEAVKNKALCFQCGSGLARRNKTGDGEKWFCKNKDCGVKVRVTGELLTEAVTIIMNEVIADPSIIENGVIPPTHTHSLEVTRLTNEINRQLEKTELNDGYVKTLIMACAAEKYSVCDEGGTHYLTERLKAEFKGHGSLTEFDTELFNRTVKDILIDKDGTIHARFINHKTISRRLG